MRSFRSSGSVEGVMGNRHPYSDSFTCLEGAWPPTLCLSSPWNDDGLKTQSGT
jgi:hypothetical protein